MKKQMTFDQRMNLAIKLAYCFLAFTMVGFLSATIGGGIGYISLLFSGIFLFFVGITFIVVSAIIRYHETKPKWQQGVDQKWK